MFVELRIHLVKGQLTNFSLFRAPEFSTGVEFLQLEVYTVEVYIASFFPKDEIVLEVYQRDRKSVV